LDLQTLQTLIDCYHYKNDQRGEKIISVRKRNPEADPTALEREIDRLVYELGVYPARGGKLTPEKIAIVKGTQR
jgi:hypothetical protein